MVLAAALSVTSAWAASLELVSIRAPQGAAQWRGAPQTPQIDVTPGPHERTNVTLQVTVKLVRSGTGDQGAFDLAVRSTDPTLACRVHGMPVSSFWSVVDRGLNVSSVATFEVVIERGTTRTARLPLELRLQPLDSLPGFQATPGRRASEAGRPVRSTIRRRP